MGKLPVLSLVILLASLVSVSRVSSEECVNYSVTNVYGPKGISSQGVGEEGCCAKGETGLPGKAGAPGIGQKGERGLQAQETITRNYWTKSKTGCSCHFNPSENDCACCHPGGCGCSAPNQHECVACGKGEMCGRVELPRSCEFIDSKKSGTFLISPDPDRYQPFYVYCDFTEGKRKTIVNHDSLGEIEVDDKCEHSRCYTRKINYNAKMNEIVALIDASENCTQFIKYRCIGSVLFQGSNFFASWVSRDGVNQRYWGGATSERDWYCACGETGTCVDKTKLCNCDRNSYEETSDEGHVTDKNKLPIAAVKFGDLGGKREEGWHTVGGLECSGRN